MFGIFLFFATVIGGVGLSGELSNTPTYSECLSVGPAYACDAEHGNGFVGSGEFDRPNGDGRANVPDVPDDDQCNDDSDNDDRNDKPGKGDRDKGHGNDDDRDDEDNPGKGKHKGRK